MKTDVAMLGTMDMGIAEMVPDNPGMWLFHCHIAVHFAAGMIGRLCLLFNRHT
jgi:hephaestin